MPLDLPAGIKPSPMSFLPNEIVPNVTGFRFDVLTNDEAYVGTLGGVEGGGVEFSAFTAIKGSGNLEVKDVGEQVDWLNARIRPMVLLDPIGAGQPTERGLGVFVCAAPREQWRGTGRRWAVELLDKSSVLDQDIVTNSDGDPVMFVAPVGANVIDTVIDLIEGVGEVCPAIEPDTVQLSSTMVWDLGTPVLKIVNELLEAGGYGSLWLDGMGFFRVNPYLPPGQRDPIYSAEAPFVVGNRSVLSPDWDRDRDIYQIPNRYVAIGQGDGTTEAAVAVVINDDVASPFSFQARGRWITRVVTGVEAASPVELEARAWMGLSQASSVTSGFDVAHAYLPDLRVNSVIRFAHPDAQLDLLTYVTKTTVPFKAGELCKSEIREAVV